MKVTEEMKLRIQAVLIHDPLFTVVRDTPMEEVLYSDSYLAKIIEKKFYSIAEVAEWFGISDAKLRYYIKPFKEYIFLDQEVTPSTQAVIRLSFLAILKLRMIMLLKDEYRVKGLKELLGIDDVGRVNPRPHFSEETAVSIPDHLGEKVDIHSNVLNQILQTGLFEFKKKKDDSETQIVVNEDFFKQRLVDLPNDSNEQIEEIKAQTEKLIKDNEILKDQIQDITAHKVKDIAVKLRERHIENVVVSELRAEALSQFESQNKIGLFKKLFYSSEIEKEKEHFISNYLKKHLYDRLELELADYYQANQLLK
ncbi:hypothetical protein AMD00_04825 [Viridibacillus arvi]|uniref:Uncharacterized protein n=1 Tax=Viridibacillus arvi TaxID=263475 RepID=A0A0M0LLI2_9BACL|nr:hypothetical protein AMD00_04825 [Viridibacillus arvi]